MNDRPELHPEELCQSANTRCAELLVGLAARTVVDMTTMPSNEAQKNADCVFGTSDGPRVTTTVDSINKAAKISHT